MQENSVGAAVVDDNGDADGAVNESTPAPNVAMSGGELLCQTISLAAVEPQKVRWLWPDRIPLGKVTLVEGDPGLGKSTVTMDLAARVSTGAPMPFYPDARAPANVLIVTCEDDLADTVRPRLDAAGADVERVFTINLDGLERFPTLPSRTRDLEVVIFAKAARMVILDPLMAFVDTGIDTNTDHHVRRVMRPLGDVARRTGAAIVVVRHLNKSTGQSAIHRGGGSIGISGAARAVLQVGKDGGDGSTRILAHAKVNNGAAARALRFHVVTAPNGAGCVEWLEECDVTADQLVGVGAARRPSELERAVDFLRRELAYGPKLKADIDRDATRQGISLSGALERAKDHVGVWSRKTNNAWWWGLPAQDADLADVADLDQGEPEQHEQGTQPDHGDEGQDD